MAHIKKGDDVIVRTGRNRGKRGTVLRIFTDDRVLVEGVNVVKRHTRANPQRGTQGGIVQKEMPVNISNINIFNPATGKAECKVTFVKRVLTHGLPILVGAGYYLDE